MNQYATAASDAPTTTATGSQTQPPARVAPADRDQQHERTATACIVSGNQPCINERCCWPKVSGGRTTDVTATSWTPYLTWL